MAKLLIIDDDPKICLFLSKLADSMGHTASTVNNLEDGLSLGVDNHYDLILLDLEFPHGNGLQILPDLLRTPSKPEVIIITGTGDARGAELAFKYGAWDYIQKPFMLDEVSLPITRALQYRHEKETTKPPVNLNRSDIIGESWAIHNCLEEVAKASVTDAGVLIIGETGTGKELFAQTIHKNSSRAKEKFIVVDCATLPENLVESILFGHSKGAFTGADKSRTGLIKEAHKGTLFLDEIGELPLGAQKAFLRVLQEGRFRPLGSNQEMESDFRLLAATNRDLKEMTQRGKFREDLFFRIQALTIEIPPLRDRQQDIRDLIMYYLLKLCTYYGRETKGMSPEFLEVMVKYNWPGNVRELVNVMERVIAEARLEPILYPQHLPPNIRIHSVQGLLNNENQGKGTNQKIEETFHHLPTLQDMRENALSKAEKHYLFKLMSLTKGNIKEACRLAGLSRSRLYGLLQKYGIPKS